MKVGPEFYGNLMAIVWIYIKYSFLYPGGPPDFSTLDADPGWPGFRSQGLFTTGLVPGFEVEVSSPPGEALMISWRPAVGLRLEGRMAGCGAITKHHPCRSAPPVPGAAAACGTRLWGRGAWWAGRQEERSAARSRRASSSFMTEASWPDPSGRPKASWSLR